MKKEDDIKVPQRFTSSKQIPKVRTPMNYMGEEISIPPKENLSNEDRVKIVKQKHEDKRKPLIVNKKQKTKIKNKK